MFISRCDPDKLSRQPGFKYRTTLEKNKLFVKGEMVNLIVYSLAGVEFFFLPYSSCFYICVSQQLAFSKTVKALFCNSNGMHPSLGSVIPVILETGH